MPGVLSTSRSSRFRRRIPPRGESHETSSAACRCARRRRARRPAAPPCSVASRSSSRRQSPRPCRRAARRSSSTWSCCRARSGDSTTPRIAEIRDTAAGPRVERDERSRPAARRSARRCHRASRQTPRVLSPRRPLAPRWRLLDPDRLARAGVECFDEADAVRAVQHAVHHERRRAEVVRRPSADGSPAISRGSTAGRRQAIWRSLTFVLSI